MIAITFTAREDGEVVFTETVPCDLPAIAMVGKTIRINGKPIELEISFDPAVVTEPPIPDAELSGA